MSIRANIARHYLIRLGIIGLGAFGFGLWFLYDGAVGYPAKREIQLAYQQLKEQHPQEYPELWPKLARERGWPLEPQTEPLSEKDIMTQYIFAGITLPIGAFFLFGLLRNSRRWVEADDEGLRTSSGQRAAWDQIESVDKSRWQNKGIAFVHYRTNGQGGRILLDDWKFDREPTNQIMAELNKRLGLEPATAEGDAGEVASLEDAESDPSQPTTATGLDASR